MSWMFILVNLALLLLFFMGSWFFSGFESGMVSLNRHRLVHRIRHGDARAKTLGKTLRDTHRLLATVLVGNNICNVTLSTLVAALALAIAKATGADAATLQTLTTAGTALALLAIGEYLPKLWFTARPIDRCARLLPLFLLLQRLLSPLATLCILLTRLVAGRNNTKRSPFVSREALAFLMRDSEAHGNISAFERMMMGRVLDLQLRRATQIMTPLRKVARVYESDNLATVLRVFRQSRHRVLPLFSDDDTRCLGLLHLFDLLRSKTARVEPFDMRRAPIFVAHDTLADELLPYMRTRNTKVVIVLDAHQRPCGLITQEDVLGAILDDELLRAATERKAPKKEAEDDEDRD